jgi:hypothetical protein
MPRIPTQPVQDVDKARRLAEGLLFACKNPMASPDFTSCGGPAAEAYWAFFTPLVVLGLLDQLDPEPDFTKIAQGFREPAAAPAPRSYDWAFEELLRRGYGPVSARGLLRRAGDDSRYLDDHGDGSGVQICALNDAGTEFSVRTVTITTS